MATESDRFLPGTDPQAARTRISRRASLGVMLGAAAGLGPDGAVTSVHAKLRHIVMADEDYGLGAGQSAAANTAALQRAVDDAQIVLLPNSQEPIRLASAVTVPPNTVISGAGPGRTQLVAEGPLAFVYEAPRGTATVQGPVFRDFTIRCAMVGIKLNDDTHGFTDSADSQHYIMAPRIDRVKLSGPGADRVGSRGVVWNKVFHGIIDQSEIIGFQIGVKSLGCDLCEIRGRTRIWQCGTLLQIERSGDLGSGFKVDGCDLLLASQTFLKASDRHLLFLNNYLESQTTALRGPVFDLDFDYIMIFQNNRIEVPATPGSGATLLRVAGEGLMFVFENNGTRGLPWGSVEWNRDNSARYHYNSVHRQRIVVRNNSPHLSVPFGTIEPPAPRNGFRDLWVITPATGGLASSYNYSGTCRVRDGAFVLPAQARMRSLVRFRDEGNSAVGRVNVHVRAKATVAGQELVIVQMEGGAYAAHAALALTRTSQWHTAFSGIATSDLAIDAYNADTARGGEAWIDAIVVERAS